MTSGERVGRLESVTLREVWQHEASDFTPWLLANADALGEALEMDLEIKGIPRVRPGLADIAHVPIGSGRDRLDRIPVRPNQR